MYKGAGLPKPSLIATIPSEQRGASIAEAQPAAGFSTARGVVEPAARRGFSMDDGTNRACMSEGYGTMVC